MATVLAPIGFYATYIERFRLQLEVVGVPVPLERDGRDPITIGVLSDIQTDHIGDYEREAVDRLMALEPDVILMPGDLFQGPDWMLERELPALRSLLAKLHAPGGVYFVQGNCETRTEAAKLLEGTGVQLLRNERRTVHVADRRLTVGGVELHYTAASRNLVEDIERNPDLGDIRILLAHYPGKVMQLSEESRIDLVVAGHTHGGQVQLPFLGPPFTETWLPRRIAAGGLHELDGRRIYISRGVGCERGQAPRVRFLCPPEITLLTIIDVRSPADLSH
jgi:predicted MPP superfamily phosphohydrolase